MWPPVGSPCEHNRSQLVSNRAGDKIGAVKAKVRESIKKERREAKSEWVRLSTVGEWLYHTVRVRKTTVGDASMQSAGCVGE